MDKLTTKMTMALCLQILTQLCFIGRHTSAVSISEIIESEDLIKIRADTVKGMFFVLHFQDNFHIDLIILVFYNSPPSGLESLQKGFFGAPSQASWRLLADKCRK